jgi:hypothetical protein
MKLYLLKVHLQTFLSTKITKKCQILSCDTLVAKERHYVLSYSKYISYKVSHHIQSNLSLGLLEPVCFQAAILGQITVN